MIFGESSERKELEQQRRSEGRLPPGQSLTLKWPVLHYGDVPRVDLRTWDFRIDGLVEKPVRLTWEEFNRLPKTEIQCDIHCVTRWSRFDNRFEGVLFTEVMKLVRPSRRRISPSFAASMDSRPTAARRPDEADHDFCLQARWRAALGRTGYPLRLIVPHLYLWKSVKWVRGFELDRRGYARLLGTKRLSHARRSVERTPIRFGLEIQFPKAVCHRGFHSL